jgi:hypothetical protein
LRVNTIIKGPSTDEEFTALKDATLDIASQAHAHLKEARKLSKAGSLSSLATHALYPAISTSLYLDRLSEYDFDPFATSVGANEHYNNFQVFSGMLMSKFTKRI